MVKNRVCAGITITITIIGAMWALINLPWASAQTETKTTNTPPKQKKTYAQTAQQKETYAGMKKCKNCHSKEYQEYSQRKYDRSWRILEMRGETKNPECLQCHTTGYGEPSGFINIERTPHLKNKQCEVCHGPGAGHASDPSNKAKRETMKNYTRKKNVCIQCHTHDMHRGTGF